MSTSIPPVAGPRPRRRWKLPLLLLALASFFGVRAAQAGLERCAWLDALLGRSGCVRALAGHVSSEMRTYVAFAPDGRLATQSGGVVRLWPAGRGEALWLQTDMGRRAPPSFSPDGALLALADATGAVRLKSLDAADRMYTPPERTLPARQGKITALGWSADSQLLLSASADGRVLVQRAADGALLREWAVAELGSAAIAPDGRAVAIATADSLSLRDVASGRTLQTLSDGSAPALAFSPDGARLAATARGGALGVWRVADGAQEQRLQLPQDATPRRFDDGSTKMMVVVPEVLAWSPDGRRIAGGGPAGWGVLIWDASSGALRTQIHPQDGPQLNMSSIAFSPDGRYVAADGIFLDAGAHSLAQDVHVWKPGEPEGQTDARP